MLVDVLNQIDSIVWGPWLLILLVGTGVFLSCRLGFLQVMKLPRALKLIFFARNKGDGDIDSFKALFSGCGWPPSSAWPPNFPKAAWP